MNKMRIADWTMIAAVAALGVLGSTSTKARAQTRFPLNCNGGSNTMELTYVTSRGGPPQLRLKFIRAADPRFLGPGECAWQDRAVAPSEPNLLCVGDARVSAGFLFNTDRNPILSGATAEDGNGDVTNMITLMTASSAFRTFQVFNDLAGCLRTK